VKIQNRQLEKDLKRELEIIFVFMDIVGMENDLLYKMKKLMLLNLFLIVT